MDTGDVVLFNRRCASMSAWGGLLCVGAKVSGGTRWDHVGVVLRAADGQLMLLEASLSGVKLRPLAERLRRSRSHEIAVRRLGVRRTPELRAAALDFAEAMAHIKYESRLGTLINIAVRPPSQAERERLHALLQQREHDARALEKELAARNLSALQRRVLRLELDHALEDAVRVRATLGRTERSVFENQQDMSAVVCSELVAGLYQHLGLLPPYPAAGTYEPRQFSSENEEGLPLLAGARLMAEEALRALPGEDAAADPEPEAEADAAVLQRAVARHGLLMGGSAEQQRQLLAQFELVELNDGDILFHQGDEGDFFYVLERGTADVEQRADEHGVRTVVATYGRGNGFGDKSLLGEAGGARNATVRVHGEPRPRLWRLPRAAFCAAVGARARARAPKTPEALALLDDVLRRHPLFQRAERDAAGFFALEVGAGELVIEQGDHGDNFYVVESGELEVVRRKPGCEPCVTQTLRRGDTFGEASLVFNSRRGAAVRVVGGAPARLWCMDRAAFAAVTGTVSTRLLPAFERAASVRDSVDGMSYMTYADLARFVGRNDARVRRLARLGDPGATGLLSFSEFVHLDLLLRQPPHQAEGAFRVLDPLGTGVAHAPPGCEAAWRAAFGAADAGVDAARFAAHAPAEVLAHVAQEVAELKALWDGARPPERPASIHDDLSEAPGRRPAAAAVAAAAARVAVAPLDVLRLCKQTAPVSGLRPGAGFGQLAAEGRLFAGTGLNVARVLCAVPLHRALIERIKAADGGAPSEARNLAAGALAGALGGALTYPLDLVRARAVAAVPGGAWPGLGPQLYRGLGPSMAGSAAFVGLSYAAHEFLRPVLVPVDAPASAWRPMLCAAAAAAVAQTAAFPLDVWRRRRQVCGGRTPWATLRGIAAEGALYRGWLLSVARILPVAGVTGLVYPLLS